jgi:predicted metal-dependent hydrolase
LLFCLTTTKPDKINYQAGEFFLFLGDSYPLKLGNTEAPVHLNNKIFYLSVTDDAVTAFHWFYKKEFIKIALPRLEYYSQKHNLIFNQVRFKAQKTRWGSCSSQNNINLNYLLMMAPMWVIDAVIAHELAHITHKNHSKDFYQLLDSMISTRKQAILFCKTNGKRMRHHRLCLSKIFYCLSVQAPQYCLILKDMSNLKIKNTPPLDS